MAAQRAGIPVVAYHRDLPDSRVVAAVVGPDSLSDGREAGAYTASHLKDVAGEKVVVELIGALNDQNGIDRSKGFREELASLDNVKLVEVPTDWDSARALSGTQNAFQANPVVHAVYAATDTHIPSVETVLTEFAAWCCLPQLWLIAFQPDDRSRCYRRCVLPGRMMNFRAGVFSGLEGERAILGQG